MRLNARDHSLLLVRIHRHANEVVIRYALVQLRSVEGVVRKADSREATALPHVVCVCMTQ